MHKSDSHEMARTDSCLLCEDMSALGILHEASIFHLDSCVWKCTFEVQDERLLAKLSAGDMVAKCQVPFTEEQN